MQTDPQHKRFKQTITADGRTGFKAETNRYHLYVAFACPYAHRILIFLKLKGLDDVIAYTVVDWLQDEEEGWKFTDQKLKCSLDVVNGCSYLKEVYLKADPEYVGSISIPVLWDKKSNTIVNNESGEIIRMLNSEFNEFCATDEQRKLDLYPVDLRAEIDGLNEWISPMINDGVYKAGFARSQEAYDVAVRDAFHALDKVENILSKNRYLTGDTLTEADIRLFPTLVRFDTAYFGLFKCNKKRIVDYPNIWEYTRDICQTGNISQTIDMQHVRQGYYQSMRNLNPSGIVPIGPEVNFNESHNRHKKLSVN